MKLKTKVIRAELQRLLVEASLPHKANAAFDKSSHALCATKWTETEATVVYGQRFAEKITTTDVLHTVLKHELCHVLTAPSANVQLPQFSSADIAQCYLAYVDLIREFLAHDEFRRRFPTDIKRFSQWDNSIFEPQRTLRPITSDGIAAHMQCFGQWFTVFYDCIGFHVMGGDAFKRWCDRHKVNAIYSAFLLAMADVEFIAAQSIDYWAKLDLMGHSWQYFLHLDALELGRGQLALSHDLDVPLLGIPPFPRSPLADEIFDRWKARGLVRATA